MEVCQVSGNDLNPGTPADPYQTIAALGVDNGTLRAGFYAEGDIIRNVNLNATGNRIIADGYVVIDATGFSESFKKTGFIGDTRSSVQLIGIELRNSIENTLNFSANNSRFFDCVSLRLVFHVNKTLFSRFKNLYKNITACRQAAQDGSALLIRETYINTTFTQHDTNNEVTYNLCAFETVSFPGNIATIFQNCAFDGVSFNGTDIKNITLSGDGNTIGNLYADGEKFSGTFANGTETVTLTNCFWTDDMLFNEPAANDYTIQLASPLLNGGNIIGAYDVGFRITPADSAFDPVNGATLTNIDRVAGVLSISSGFSSGTCETTQNLAHALELPLEATISRAVQFFGMFALGNYDGIDKDGYVAGVSDQVRRTYEISFYNENTLVWSPFYEMEIWQAVELDISSRGNGNVDADMNALGAATFKIFALRITLQEGID